MAKILIKPQHKAFWFERLSAVSYYSEAQFEERLLNQSSFLFKDHWVIPFKKQLSHTSDAEKTTKPDLLFIKKDYTEWILVEAELGSHQFPHVEKQLEVMSNPDFNNAEMLQYIKSKSGYIFEQDFSFDDVKLKKMIDDLKPKVMVIVDETIIKWEADLKRLKVLLCVVQVYKNGENEEIFRLKGEYPKTFTGAIHCRKAKYPANSIEVINWTEALDGYITGEEIEVYFQDSLTKWNVIINNRKKCIFKCIGPNFPLPVNRDFTLQLDAEKRLYYFNQN